jgi:hypothetical protein
VAVEVADTHQIMRQTLVVLVAVMLHTLALQLQVHLVKDSLAGLERVLVAQWVAVAVVQVKLASTQQSHNPLEVVEVEMVTQLTFELVQEPLNSSEVAAVAADTVQLLHLLKAVMVAVVVAHEVQTTEPKTLQLQHQILVEAAVALVVVQELMATHLVLVALEL